MTKRTEGQSPRKKPVKTAPQTNKKTEQEQKTMFDLREWIEKNYKIIFIVLIALAVLTRFYHLDYKVFHHDESLYAKYVWDYSKGGKHIYDPLMHGPLLFQLNGTLMRYIGDSDYTARVVPAFLGVLTVAGCMLMTPIFGATAAVTAGIFMTLSPSITYFTRFLRMDAYVITFTYFAMIFFIYFIKRSQWRWLYLSTLSLAFLFCTKENSFLHTFEFVSFMVLVQIYPIVVRLLTKKKIFPDSTLGEWVNRMLRFIWRHKFKVLIAFGLFFGIFYLLYTDFFRNPRGFIDGLGRKAIPYWKNQNKIRRVRGDYHYHLWRMIAYELPLIVGFLWMLWTVFKNNFKHLRAALAVSFILLVLYTFTGHYPLPAFKIVGDYGHLWDHPQKAAELSIFSKAIHHMHMQCWGHVYLFLFVAGLGFWSVLFLIHQGKKYKAFFIYWAVFSFLLYSYLGEKVPWLTIHIYQPLILGFAVFSRDLVRKSSKIFLPMMVISIAFMAYANYGLNFYKDGVNEANPAEIIVYTQTDDEIEELNEIIYTASDEVTGLGHDMPMSVQGDATWPYSWYLRHYKRWFYGQNVTPPADAIIAIMDWNKQNDYGYIFGDRYVMERRKLRSWCVLPNLHKSREQLSFNKVLRYMLFRLEREPLVPTGSVDVAVYIRNDVAEGRYDKDFGKDTKAKEEFERRARALKPVFITSESTFGSRGDGTGQFNEPRAIAVDQQGNIYVADTLNHRIQKFSPQGEFLKAWGEAGKEQGQFDKPKGIAVGPDGNVYVSDTWNHRIQVFDPEGNFLKTWGESGCGPDTAFWAPKGMDFDADGNIYLTNTGCHQIHKFTKDGAPIKKAGYKSAQDTDVLGGLHEPVGLAVGPNQKIYVCDTANHRIQVFSKDLKPLDQYKVWGWNDFYTEPFVVIDDNGTLFVSDSSNNRIMKFSSDGELEKVWGRKGTGSGQFNRPRGMDIKDGKLYIVDCDNHRIQIFDLEKVYQATQ